jgi:5-deoxy-glucuronate isomerase
VTSRWHLPAATLASDGDPVVVTPERAGWRYTGLTVARLGPGERRVIATGAREMLVLPLSGGCVVELDATALELKGRESVFTGISDLLYLPPGSEATAWSDAGVELALPWAREAERRHPAAYVPAADIVVEVRGAGRATRQINDLFTARHSRAHRLAVVEVLTPGGNWSSYPPHKHDESSDAGEEALEEIYYFRIAGDGGFGLHRTYTADGALDETVTVRDGDVFLVPRGYHGPCVAPPEYPMYYLNVLAGPGDARALGYTDDPAYGWIRSSWATMERDARVPLVRTAERDA